MYTHIFIILLVVLLITFACIFKELIYKRQLKQVEEYNDIKKKIDENMF